MKKGSGSRVQGSGKNAACATASSSAPPAPRQPTADARYRNFEGWREDSAARAGLPESWTDEQVREFNARRADDVQHGRRHDLIQAIEALEAWRAVYPVRMYILHSPSGTNKASAFECGLFWEGDREGHMDGDSFAAAIHGALAVFNELTRAAAALEAIK